MSDSSEERTFHRWQPRAAKLAIVLLIAALSLSGCKFNKFWKPKAEPTAVAPTEPAAAADEDGTLPRLIERAIADLVQATSAEADEITVVSTEEVEWGDTSLGCPAPDEMYAQMITPGYLIVLQSGATTYDFHSGADPEGPLVQCVDGVPAEGESQADEDDGPLSGAQDEILARLIERATADLAQATSAAADAVSVVSTEEVEWSDSSLDCPEPDAMYLQVITPGYLIVLESGGNTYEYHSGTDPEGPLVHCADDEPAEGEAQVDEEVAPLSGAQDEVLSRLIERATADLVRAVSAATDGITVVSTEEVEWSDTSLGCPQPDEMYAQMITPGYLIVLDSGGDTYEYHSGTDPEGPLVQCNSEADSEE